MSPSPDKQHSPTGHMPCMASQPSKPHPRPPRVYHGPLARITRDMVFDRIYLLLADNLPTRWTQNPEALVHLTKSMANVVISSGQYGDFGPYGLSSLAQISVYIGHEGIYHYMCLAVHPSYGDVRIIFRGNLCERESQDPIIHHEAMALCRIGFDRAADRLYADIVSRMPKKRSA
ncbi:hypothetical protein COCSADRAFT_88403 [Bipolaris sorokiniana ND90Pr]|uniref:Uncharacterized protein n=1 Tax=Cochliobolus sativus (strain ND90Pr / ATCC 201652) TaxID=665912 RepID=M2SCG2_COCSN|nr:uncharacterized protein COCSADRAFT_88403 [Bipolaris sorokiniana ND90Pr]EMD64983.1 hypothetical protein COCSADRAFT_88403 [Bipolaris sorokiniana ND90Pr]